MNRLIFIALLWACQSTAQDVSTAQSENSSQEVDGISIPEGYSIIQMVDGDLDQDGIDERIVAFNTEEIKERSFKNVTRELAVFKQEAEKWTKWKSSMQALYGSRGGGMMGDPFDTMYVEKGILQIRQEGGSSWKWAFTDKYRFQNDELYLIGYTSISGAPCEYFLTADFNISTGKVIVEKEFEDCDTDPSTTETIKETAMVPGLKIMLQNRHDKRVHIVTPKEKLEVFVSTGPNKGSY